MLTVPNSSNATPARSATLDACTSANSLPKTKCKQFPAKCKHDYRDCPDICSKCDQMRPLRRGGSL